MKSIENQNFIERLEFFAKEKKGSVNAFEESCNLKKGLIAGAKFNSGSFGTDKIIKILIAYPNMNLDWIFLGKGEMEKKEEKNIQIGNNINGNNNQHISLAQSDCEKELHHLRELLAEKDKRILLLEKLLEKM